MNATGFDTWGLGPSAAEAKAAGMAFRTWYSSFDVSKDGPVSGPADYAAEGIWSVTNFETTIDRVLSGGYSGGQQDMMHTINEYVPRGMPLGAVVILSADESIPASAFPAALSYYQGARQAAAGQYLTGCYGEQALIAYLKAHGAVEVGWRSMSTAWPGGASTDHCDLIQTGSGQIGGVDVDYDTALVSFFGQWMPGRLAPRTPDPLPKEDEMILTDIQGSTVIWALSGNLYWPVADAESMAAYRAAHITEVTITQAEHQAILAAVAAAKPAVSGSVPVTLSGSGTLAVG